MYVFRFQTVEKRRECPRGRPVEESNDRYHCEKHSNDHSQTDVVRICTATEQTTNIPSWHYLKIRLARNFRRSVVANKSILTEHIEAEAW